MSKTTPFRVGIVFVFILFLVIIVFVDDVVAMDEMKVGETTNRGTARKTTAKHGSRIYCMVENCNG